MFPPLKSGADHRQRSLAFLSVTVHLLLLLSLIWPRRAIFVAPSSIQQGEQGTSSTPIYFYSSKGAGTTPSMANKVYWPRRPKPARVAKFAQSEENERQQSLAASDSTRAGSSFGSLTTGSLYGQEVRPALPIVSRDPVFAGQELASAPAGSVVVEITIDEAGRIIDKRVTQSLSPAIDAEVLAALEEWRFLPATRNGVPIPSKQDVYYHFPR